LRKKKREKEREEREILKFVFEREMVRLIYGYGGTPDRGIGPR
jgi:hypothetical protein